MVCYTISFIDRQILSLLVAPIRADLGISDTQMGLLGGLAFAIFYSVLGVPFGRMADSYSRRNIIAAGVFFWSLMTAVCAVARSYTSLFLARMGVGVGEATLGPAAFSMISDYFPGNGWERRSASTPWGSLSAPAWRISSEEALWMRCKGCRR